MPRVGLEHLKWPPGRSLCMSECQCGEEGEPGALSEQSAAVAQEKQVWREGQPHRMAVHSPRQTPHPNSKATRNEIGGGSVGPHFPEYKKSLGLLQVVPNLTSYPELHPRGHGLLQEPQYLGCPLQRLHGP